MVPVADAPHGEGMVLVVESVVPVVEGSAGCGRGGHGGHGGPTEGELRYPCGRYADQASSD